MVANRRARSRIQTALLEALEPRLLLAGLPVISGPREFVLNDATSTYLGALKSKKYMLPGETPAHGPELSALVNWGDGTSSQVNVGRDAKGTIHVWGAHGYTALKKYRLRVMISTNGAAPKVAFEKSTKVLLNAPRGKTVTPIAGVLFGGMVASVDKAKGLAIVPGISGQLTLPAGTGFAQFVTPVASKATLRIDWGDGEVSDGFFQANGKKDYRVLGHHTYGEAGNYRIRTFVVITSLVDDAVLHMDMVSSTAQVKASAGARPVAIGSSGVLLASTPITFGEVLPNVVLTGQSSPPGLSGGIMSGVVVNVGAGTGSASLNFNGSGLNLVTVSSHLSLGAGNGVVAKFKGNEFAQAELSVQGGQSGPNPVGQELLAALNGASLVSATGIVKQRTSSGYTALDATTSAGYLLNLHAGNLIFDLNTPANVINGIVMVLPADYVGTVVVGPATPALTASLPAGATLLRLQLSGSFLNGGMLLSGGLLGGVTSSSAQGANSPNYAVGVVDNNPGGTSNGGQNTDPNNLLVAVARIGDTNRDGIIDINDLGALANKWQQPDNIWEKGDFNRDGFVDILDLGILAANWAALGSTATSTLI